MGIVVITVHNSDFIGGTCQVSLFGCPDTIFISPPLQELSLLSNKS